MGKDHPILKGEVRIRRQRLTKIRSVWFWVCVQAIGAGLCTFLHYMKLIPHLIIFGLRLISIFGICYWQLRSTPLEGIEITLESGYVGKWNVIRMGGVRSLAIVFKTSIGLHGAEKISVFPFLPSRWRMVNSFKLFVIKFAVWAAIIQ